MFNFLVVEDNPDHGYLISRQLKSNFKCRIDLIEDGDTALQQLRDRHYDAVLLDMELPGRNGLEVLHEFQKEMPAVPIIMVTGYGNEEVAVEALKQGAFDYVSKGFDLQGFNKLPIVIEKAIAHYTANDRIRVSEQQIDALLELSEELILQINAEGIIQIACARFNHVLGYTPADLVGTPFTDLLAENNLRHIKILLAKLLSGKINFISYTGNFFHRNGDTVALEWKLKTVLGSNHAPAFVVAVGHPVESQTGRENGRNVLPWSRVRDALHTIFNSLGSYQDDPDYFRNALEKLSVALGIDALLLYEYAPGNQDLRLVHHYALPESLRSVLGMIHSQEFQATRKWREGKFEYLLFHDTSASISKRLLPVSEEGFEIALGMPIPDSNGKAIGLLLMLSRNPTERPEQETDLLDLAVNQLGRMIEMGRLREALRTRSEKFERKLRDQEATVHGTAHDLKNPLTAIGGFLSLLEKRFEQRMDRNEKEWVERIHANLRYIDKLATALGDLVRMKDPPESCQTIYPDRIVTGIFDRLFPGSCDNVDADEEEKHPLLVVTDSIPPVWCSDELIHKIFANLIDNAIKFADPKRCLRIEVGGERSTSIPDQVHIWVRDNGIGISKEDQANIFDLLWCTRDTSKNGWGMGLALVLKAVETCGGSITVESSRGEGTTFHLHLPAVKA